MPTTKQLNDLWEMELNFPSTRRTDDPMYVAPKIVEKFTGRAIGYLEVNRDTKDIKIVVDETKT